MANCFSSSLYDTSYTATIILIDFMSSLNRLQTHVSIVPIVRFLSFNITFKRIYKYIWMHTSVYLCPLILRWIQAKFHVHVCLSTIHIHISTLEKNYTFLVSLWTCMICMSGLFYIKLNLIMVVIHVERNSFF